MKDSHDFLVGTVTGFQALSGEVKIKTSTNSPDLLLDVKSVLVEYAPGMKPLKSNDGGNILAVRSARLEKRMLIMAFEGYRDRTSVEHLEGARLFCKEDELLPLEEEEFWVSDLVGLEVFTTQGARVGKVVSIISSGNDLLEVAPDSSSGSGSGSGSGGEAAGKTILVPFVKDIVPTVDMKGKKIEVVDIPGLLEPQ